MTAEPDPFCDLLRTFVPSEPPPRLLDDALAAARRRRRRRLVGFAALAACAAGVTALVWIAGPLPPRSVEPAPHVVVTHGPGEPTERPGEAPPVEAPPRPADSLAGLGALGANPDALERKLAALARDTDGPAGPIYRATAVDLTGEGP